MMLTDLADVLRAGGLKVKEVDGWKTRGHGPMTDVKGVTCHHTASGRGTGETLGLRTIIDGRPGLDGPLAQLYLNRAGVFYTVAAGLCYHAGDSQEPNQTNSHRIGIEALAAGDGWSMDWPPDQYHAYAQGAYVLGEHYGFKNVEILGHKETCKPHGRKTDPSFDMGVFRRTAVTLGKNLTTANAKDDDMEWNDPRKLTVTDASAYGGDSKPGDLSSWSVAVRYPPAVERFRRETAEKLKVIKEEMDEIKALQAEILAQLKPKQ